jgi:predicted dinucleotide-binding enzyme
MAKQKIGVLGSGIVGRTLATAFLQEGHDVMLSSRNATKDELIAWRIQNPTGLIGNFADAALFAEIVVLAVQGEYASNACSLADTNNLTGKVIIDATNPISHDVPPVNGVLHYFTPANESLMEQLQVQHPAAMFVKAFNSVGNAYMYKPDFNGVKPTMFICGNDAGAKQTVTEILHAFGWETADMGKVQSARPIESLCILWCAPGFNNNQWSHAFKLLKK